MAVDGQRLADRIAEHVLLAGDDDDRAIDQAAAAGGWQRRRGLPQVVPLQQRHGRLGLRDMPAFAQVGDHRISASGDAGLRRHPPRQRGITGVGLGVKAAGPVAQAIEAGLAGGGLGEELGGRRPLELRMVEHHRRIALPAVPDAAILADAQVRAADLARGDEIGIEALLPERIGQGGAQFLEAAAGPVHGVGMAEDDTHRAVKRGLGDEVEQADAAVAAQHRAA